MGAKRDSNGLTPKQREFVLFYVQLGNAAEAARRAGYSMRSAEDLGRKLVRKGPVAAAIAAAEARLLQKLEVRAEDVLQEVARIAFFDPRNLFRTDGTLKPTTEWPAHVAAAVHSLEFGEWRAGGNGVECRTVKLKFWNKNDALDRLFKHLGLYEPNAARSTASTPADRERQAQVRMKYIALLDEMAMRNAAPPPAVRTHERGDN